MLSRRLLHGSLRTTLRCTGIDTCAGSRRFSSRFTKSKKRVEVLEKEPDRGQPSIFDRPQQQVRLASSSLLTPSDPGPGPILTVLLNLRRQAPASSSFPSYVQPEREQQAGTQWDALSSGTVDHMRKVYGTLATGIGIAAGASLFTMVRVRARVRVRVRVRVRALTLT